MTALSVELSCFSLFCGFLNLVLSNSSGYTYFLPHIINLENPKNKDTKETFAMKAILLIVVFLVVTILPAIFRHAEIEIEVEFSAIPPKLKVKVKKKADRPKKEKHKDT